MGTKKRHWLWNILIVLTLVLCVLAFVEHYKNWYKIEEGNFKIFSGLYYQKIPLTELDSVLLVDKLPEMERSSGFSWMEKEKGVFMDSITQTKIYVFVDDLYQQKIKVVHHDSLKMYLNLKDSLETQKLYAILQSNLSGETEQSN
ncbi:MAG: hypothetical protein CBB72_019050 [Muricauda sp. TMED12]|nr:MAG: hypothetical protein CBB72_019050 [Muricauda sp. TMED12]